MAHQLHGFLVHYKCCIILQDTLVELDRAILEEIERLGSNPHLRKGSHQFFTVHLTLKILYISYSSVSTVDFIMFWCF